MRIISGKYRGKQIFPPKGFSSRPTTDQAKESLFNILTNNFDFEEISVLDLFAGTGIISYELASRGCPDITTVELNRKSAAFIQKTVNDLKLDEIKVVQGNAMTFIKRSIKKYDVIFADPPFDMKGVELIPQMVLDNELLTPEGWLILEHSDKVKIPYSESYIDKRNYGRVNFSIFERK